MLGKRLLPPWTRRRSEEPPSAPSVADLRAPAPASPAAAATPPREPFPRAGSRPLRHEWLDVAIARPTILGVLPVGRARVLVHPWPPGARHPLEPVARALTDAEGKTSFHLPVGRYALSATHGGERKTVGCTVDHPGRVTLLLDAAPRVRTLAVEVVDPEGHPLAGVPVEAAPAGDAAARGAVRATTDAQGRAHLALPSGPHEVRAAGGLARVDLAAEDARLRLVAHRAADAPA